MSDNQLTSEEEGRLCCLRFHHSDSNDGELEIGPNVTINREFVSAFCGLTKLQKILFKANTKAPSMITFNKCKIARDESLMSLVEFLECDKMSSDQKIVGRVLLDHLNLAFIIEANCLDLVDIDLSFQHGCCVTKNAFSMTLKAIAGSKATRTLEQLTFEDIAVAHGEGPQCVATIADITLLLQKCKELSSLDVGLWMDPGAEADTADIESFADALASHPKLKSFLGLPYFGKFADELTSRV